MGPNGSEWMNDTPYYGEQFTFCDETKWKYRTQNNMVQYAPIIIIIKMANLFISMFLPFHVEDAFFALDRKQPPPQYTHCIRVLLFCLFVRFFSFYFGYYYYYYYYLRFLYIFSDNIEPKTHTHTHIYITGPFGTRPVTKTKHQSRILFFT